MSRNRENYSINVRNLFDEVYGLASTQALKNKDIPEGGSKGAILPDLGANPETVFKKYVDALIDLLLPGRTPGVKDRIVDLYGKEEIVSAKILQRFLLHVLTLSVIFSSSSVRTRALPTTWRGSRITLVPAVRRGGRLRPLASPPRRTVACRFIISAAFLIPATESDSFGSLSPHDTYAMTSRSVRGYTTGIYRKLGLKEEEVRKVQTGGPDGDLGSSTSRLIAPPFPTIG